MTVIKVPSLDEDRFKIKGISEGAKKRKFAIIIENNSETETLPAKLFDNNNLLTEERAALNFGNDVNIILKSAIPSVSFNAFRAEMDAMNRIIEMVEVVSNDSIQQNMPYEFKRTFADGTQYMTHIFHTTLMAVEISPETDDLIFNMLPKSKIMVLLHFSN